VPGAGVIGRTLAPVLLSGGEAVADVAGGGSVLESDAGGDGVPVGCVVVGAALLGAGEVGWAVAGVSAGLVAGAEFGSDAGACPFDAGLVGAVG